MAQRWGISSSLPSRAMVATLLQGCKGKEGGCPQPECSHHPRVTGELVLGYRLVGRPFCMASGPDMCKCRVYEKRLVQGEEAKGGVAAVPGCLMGVTGEKEPDSSRRCAGIISTP